MEDVAARVLDGAIRAVQRLDTTTPVFLASHGPHTVGAVRFASSLCAFFYARSDVLQMRPPVSYFFFCSIIRIL